MPRIYHLLLLMIVVGANNALAQEASTTNAQPNTFTYVDVSNAGVIAAARFAASSIQRGKLYKTILAQEQANENGIMYVLTIEVVDAHIKHHRYSVQVFVPTQDAPWEVIDFTPLRY